MSSLAWPVTPGVVRRPRFRLFVNQQPVTGVESVEIHLTNHRKASTMSAHCALNADPGLLTTWANTDPPIFLEVQAAFLTDDQAEGQESWQSIFLGDLSDVHIDLPHGALEITGRDLAGRLIDGRTRETFANQTSSEIATTIAGRFGLTADVDATTTKAGVFYQLEHDKLTGDSLNRTTTYWDLLCFLAKEDGYDLWVTGKVLHYKQPVNVATKVPYPLVWSPEAGDVGYPSIPVTDVRIDRSCTVNKHVKVIVKTWNSKHKSSGEISFPPGASSDAQEYPFVKPGWSPQKALVFAQAQYADILKHERTIDISLPGELVMTAQDVVSLTGTGTSFDTTYYVDELTREFSFTGGFTEHLVLKNHSVQSGADVS